MTAQPPHFVEDSKWGFRIFHLLCLVVLVQQTSGTVSCVYLGLSMTKHWVKVACMSCTSTSLVIGNQIKEFRTQDNLRFYVTGFRITISKLPGPSSPCHVCRLHFSPTRIIGRASVTCLGHHPMFRLHPGHRLVMQTQQ
jgi:hypothetical protein